MTRRRLPRRCIDCGTPTRSGSRCGLRARAYNRAKHRGALYAAEYRRAAARVVANATCCWRCGQPARVDDPFETDHVIAGKPGSPPRTVRATAAPERSDDRGGPMTDVNRELSSRLRHDLFPPLLQNFSPPTPGDLSAPTP
jgi:hypothetical protein